MTWNIDDYEFITRSTAIYPDALADTNSEGYYLALGLCGEAGEVAEKIKKLYRDGIFDSQEFSKELGDVFWYLVRLCHWNGTAPSDILSINVNKLMDRKGRGVLNGEGDNR